MKRLRVCFAMARERAMSVSRANSPKLPPPAKKALSFPPLMKQWTVKSEASWPGAEYTRRTRLKTALDEDYSEDFVEEMRATLGEHFGTYAEALQPVGNRKLTRGKPAGGSGSRLPPSLWTLRHAEGAGADESGDQEDPMAATTLSLSGTMSKKKIPGNMYTTWGSVPEHLFEDREKMHSFDEWFDKYGRPEPASINLGPRQLYTHFEKSSKRCCGEPSKVTTLKKGFVTQ